MTCDRCVAILTESAFDDTGAWKGYLVKEHYKCSGDVLCPECYKEEVGDGMDHGDKSSNSGDMSDGSRLSGGDQEDIRRDA